MYLIELGGGGGGGGRRHPSYIATCAYSISEAAHITGKRGGMLLFRLLDTPTSLEGKEDENTIRDGLYTYRRRRHGV